MFMGKIQPGSRVLIVDDVVTYGSTLANLRGWLEQQGATVVGATTLTAGFGGTKLALPYIVRDWLLDCFPTQAKALANELGFSADCFTNREAPFSDGPQERIRNATIYRCRLGIEARSRAPAFFGTLKSNRPTFTRMIDSYMSSSDKLKLPEIRFLTPEEDQQLTDLAEDMAQD
jgi:hypothetical protein